MEQKPFDQFIEEFLESLMNDMNLGVMTPEEQIRLRGVLEQLIQKRILSTIVDNMTNELFDELMQKLNEKDYTEDEELLIFAEMSNRIPGFSEILADALRDLYKELTQDAAEIEELLKENEG